MSNDIALIEYYYFKAGEAFKVGNYNQAAPLYKQCYDLYQNADLNVFDKRLKDLAAKALRKYEGIIKM